MSMEINTFCAAHLAGIEIPHKNIFAPLLVFVMSHSRLAGGGVAFIRGMRRTPLEVCRTSPFIRSGTFFDPSEKLASKCRILLEFFLSRANFTVSYWANIGTEFGAVFLTGCGRRSKFFVASQAMLYKRWSVAILRTILTGTVFSHELARQFIKYLAAMLTNSFHSFRPLASIGGIGAFMGAILPHTISDAIFRKSEGCTAILTNSIYHFHSTPKKVLPARRAVLCLRQNQFSLLGSMRKQNPPVGCIA